MHQALKTKMKLVLLNTEKVLYDRTTARAMRSRNFYLESIAADFKIMYLCIIIWCLAGGVWLFVSEVAMFPLYVVTFFIFMSMSFRMVIRREIFRKYWEKKHPSGSFLWSWMGFPGREKHSISQSHTWLSFGVCFLSIKINLLFVYATIKSYVELLIQVVLVSFNE